MKIFNKFLVSLLLFAFGITCVYAAEITKFSKGFKKAFKDCDRYEETIKSEFEGRQFTTHRQIKGWKNGFCDYQEIIATQDEKYQLNCDFTGVQVDELSESMKDRSREIIKHELDVFLEQTDPKTGKIRYTVGGTTTIKGNKAFITWAKYQNNPYFCKRKKL